jgi:hypothetical protein
MAGRAIYCARNNALWCDAVCRANGAPGEFHDAIWLNRHAVPPFYSNAVTLTPGGAAGQLALIEELAAARRAFSVKDSFAALDLRPWGFEALFEATWLWRAADGQQMTDDRPRTTDSHDHAPGRGPWSVVSGQPSGLMWSAVTDETGLARWEAAWAGLHAGQLVPDSERIFRPALLAEPGVAFLAGSRRSEIVAVAAANLTGDVVGLSNVFAPDEDAAACWAGAVALATALFPDRPLVGYERGDDLALARSLGFQPLGDLRVWVRDE